jgi:hypothetical protein
MKSISQMVLLSIILSITAGLIYNPILISPIFAAKPDPCFGKKSVGCPNMVCSTSQYNTATCCWTDIHDDKVVCQQCHVNTDSGNLENCSNVENKGKSDRGFVAPPPSGVAPPPSTETCPDNTAKDSNGNCTPSTQSPGDSSNDEEDDDDNKPQFPRGNILGELQTNSELQPQS